MRLRAARAVRLPGRRLSRDAAPPLLGPHDPDPVERIAGRDGAPFLIVADHAGDAIPVALGDLGLPAAERARHIALDLGVAGLARALSRLTGAPALLQRYSRLVIDCNRAPDAPAAVVAASDGTPVPGNASLSPQARAARIAAIHTPWQAAIAAGLAAGPPGMALVALHSFTPALATSPAPRPWHCGALHLGDSALSMRMLALLRAEGDLVVGDNQPYAMDGTDFTVPHHAASRGRPYAEIEVRQDLIADAAGQQAWAARLARLLAQALEGDTP
jgi:predicted N-formylglutamate amidohydrolase